MAQTHYTETIAVAGYLAGMHESYRAEMTAYFAEFRRLFGRPLSTWEIEAAGTACIEGVPVQDAVYAANTSWVRRKADRNV